MQKTKWAVIERKVGDKKKKKKKKKKKVVNFTVFSTSVCLFQSSSTLRVKSNTSVAPLRRLDETGAVAYTGVSP